MILNTCTILQDVFMNVIMFHDFFKIFCTRFSTTITIKYRGYFRMQRGFCQHSNKCIRMF